MAARKTNHTSSSTHTSDPFPWSAAFLIIFGFLLLLQNLGVISYNLWQFWPLILVIIGLHILLDHKH